MGYERRGASFNFVGFVPIGKTYRIVEDEEETPALRRGRSPLRSTVGGTLGLSAAEFVRERAAGRLQLEPLLARAA